VLKLQVKCSTATIVLTLPLRAYNAYTMHILVQALRAQAIQDKTAMVAAYRQHKAAQYANMQQAPTPHDIFRRNTAKHSTNTTTSSSSSSSGNTDASSNSKYSIHSKHNSMTVCVAPALVMLKKPFNTALNIQSELDASAKMATRATHTIQDNSEKDMQSAHTPPALPHHTPYAAVRANTAVLLEQHTDEQPQVEQILYSKAENLQPIVAAAADDVQLQNDLKFDHRLDVGGTETELVRRYLEVAETGAIDKDSALLAISDVTAVPLHQLKFIARDIEENGYGTSRVVYSDNDDMQYTDSNNVYACDWRDEHVRILMYILIISINISTLRRFELHSCMYVSPDSYILVVVLV
jgi:hypothetical protein